MRAFHNRREPSSKPPITVLGVCAIGLLVFASTVGFSGCQSSWPVDSPAPLLDNSQFMGAWMTYLHCRSNMELDEIQIDLQRLTLVANTVAGQSQISVHLPAAIRFLIRKPPTRLAVDPQSMAVACALHGGHIAESAGRRQLAHELFTAVVAAEELGDHSYYVAEARRELEHLEQETPVTKALSELVIPVSSR